MSAPFQFYGVLFAASLLAFGQDFQMVRRDTPIPGFGFSPSILDFDRDGIPDLILWDQTPLFLHGNGDGTFASPKPTSGDLRGGTPAIADFNGDGNLDIVNKAGLWLGNGDGTFRLSNTPNPLSNLLTNLAPPGAALAADFNGDGTPDAAASGFDAIQVFAGNGNGTFRTFFRVSGTANYAFYSADLDQNGFADLLISTPAGIRRFLGNAQSMSEAPLIPLPFTAQINGLSDLNGDGAPDFLLRDKDAALYVMLAGPGGTYGDPVSIDVRSYTGTFADLDGDAQLDLVLPVGASILMRRGLGDGTFGPAFEVTTSPGYYSPIFAGDLNRDGRTDLALIGLGVLSVSLNRPLSSGETPVPTAVSSANWRTNLAPGSLATLFGNGFPAENLRLRVRSGSGGTWPAEVLYASATQINFRIPEATPPEGVFLDIANTAGSFILAGVAFIEPLAPALFNCGPGTNALLATAETPEGITQPVVPCVYSRYSFPAVVTFYGTGFAGATVDNTEVWMQGSPVKPFYVGPGGRPGLELIRVFVEPGIVAGNDDDSYSSWVRITVNGRETNGGYTNIW